MTRSATRAVLASLVLLAGGCARGSDGMARGQGGSDDVVGDRAAIVDGHEAAASEVGAVVALVTASTRATVCTGTLIAPRVVVTAAHCMAPRLDQLPSLAIVAGATRPSESTAALHGIARVTMPHGFPGPLSPDPTTLGADHDLAVLVLADPITDVMPVPVLPASRLDEALVAGTTLTIAGYGADDIDGTAGRGVLRIGTTTVSRASAEELLAGEGATSDTCYGDSGGPAFVTLDGGTWLLGVTSRASGTASTPCGDGTIFTLAPAWSSLISSQVDGGGCSVGGSVHGCWPTALVLVSLLRRRRARA